MNDVLGQVFTFWTFGSVITAVLSGIAMAAVVIHLRPGADTRLTSYLAAVLGVLWYLPLVLHRSIDDAVPLNSAVRTIGTFLLFEVGFVLPMALTLAWYRRRHP